VGLPERVVTAYHEVFFDVGPALTTGATDWLLAEAVGWSPFGGFTAPLPWAAWRLAAVSGGPLLAGVVIATTSGRPLPPAFADPGGADDMHVRETARLWVAAMAAVTPAAFADVLREYRRFRMAETRHRGRTVRVESVVRSMESFLLSRSVSGVSGVSSSAVSHHEREDIGDVSEPVEGTTHSRGGESAGSGQQARLTSSQRPGPAARRTHAA
jgi:hypothetical protein